MSRPLVPRCLSNALAATLLIVNVANAQKTAQLRVRVTDELGVPAESAAVWVDLNRNALTDKAGIAIFGQVAVGQRLVRIRKNGYRTESRQVEFKAGRREELTFAITPVIEVIHLAPITVEAERQVRHLTERGFYERRKTGSGTFLDRQDLAIYDNMSDLVPAMRLLRGFLVWPSGASGYEVLSTRGAIGLRSGKCRPVFIVDGTPWATDMVQTLTPWDVEGIEAYPGPSTAPPQYAWGAGPAGTTAACGVILIWLRARGN